MPNGRPHGTIKVSNPKKVKGQRNHRKRAKAKRDAEVRAKQRERDERKRARKYSESNNYSRLAREYGSY